MSQCEAKRGKEEEYPKERRERSVHLVAFKCKVKDRVSLSG